MCFFFCTACFFINTQCLFDRILYHDFTIMHYALALYFCRISIVHVCGLHNLQSRCHACNRILQPCRYNISDVRAEEHIVKLQTIVCCLCRFSWQVPWHRVCEGNLRCMRQVQTLFFLLMTEYRQTYAAAVQDILYQPLCSR